MEGKISTVQSGGKAKRSTTDHLIRLETTIREALARNEHIISIFFDVEKAYDTTCKYGIMKDLHHMGLRGHLPNFIQQFLKDRTFQVKASNQLSSMKQQYMRVPQGSVLSVILFIIKIDGISQLIPKNSRFQCTLLMIFNSATDIMIWEKWRQKCKVCLNRIAEWADQKEFRFSQSKTKAMKFTNNNRSSILQSAPKLWINGEEINYA